MKLQNICVSEINKEKEFEINNEIITIKHISIKFIDFGSMCYQSEMLLSDCIANNFSLIRKEASKHKKLTSLKNTLMGMLPTDNQMKYIKSSLGNFDEFISVRIEKTIKSVKQTVNFFEKITRRKKE